MKIIKNALVNLVLIITIEKLIKKIIMSLKLKSIYFIIFFVLSSCNKEKAASHRFSSQSAQYDILYPLKITTNEDNFIEILNYKSEYDSVKSKDRYPILYLFITDTIVSKSEIIELTGKKKIDFADFYVYDEKFKIPKYLFKDKKGAYKLTIAILDIIAKDTIKSKSNHLDDKIEMDMIDSRSYHDITID